MKIKLLAAALLLVASAIPAESLTETASLSTTLSYAIEASRPFPSASPVLSRVDYALSKFDSSMVDAFRVAWTRSSNGSSSNEGVVLILRMVGGGFSAREMGATNEYKKFTFRWHPATIAI